MSLWDHAFTIREFILDFAIISTLLIVGTLCRRYVKVFQWFLIPNTLIAGFIGLLLGPELIDALDFSTERMGVYLYHLLALTFVGVGLLDTGAKRSRGAINVGFTFILSYLIQILVGLGIALGMVYMVTPTLIPAVGMLLPLGFGMGPGVAFSIGQAWEPYGFLEGGNVGLTVAAIGFLVAYLSGMFIVNHGIRHGTTKLLAHGDSTHADIRTGLLTNTEKPIGARLTLHPSAIDSLTFHVALIGFIYLSTYLLTATLAETFNWIGAEREIALVWSFHFIMANLVALATRKLFEHNGGAYLLDTGMISRVTGLVTDYMIAAAIMAISLNIAWTYIIPVLLMCFFGALLTYVGIKWVSARVYDDHHFERFVGAYGEMTGTISSGLALVRVTDPELRTPVAQDLAMGSGVALVLGFPLLFIINMPFTFFEGQIEGYWTAVGISLTYLAFILILWTRFGLKMRKVATL